MPSPAAHGTTGFSSSSSLPLAGVRVFLHIRSSPAYNTAANGKEKESKVTLRELRSQIRRLGATTALSDAAADLIVFHGGSRAFLTAMQAQYKTVVRPDYLAACLATDQRLGVAPYAVTLEEEEKKGKKGVEDGSGGTERTPARGSAQKRRRTPSSAALTASFSSSTKAAHDGNNDGRKTLMVEASEGTAAALQSVFAEVRPATHRQLLLDDDSESPSLLVLVGEQAVLRPVEVGSTACTGNSMMTASRSFLLLDEEEEMEDGARNRISGAVVQEDRSSEAAAKEMHSHLTVASGESTASTTPRLSPVHGVDAALFSQGTVFIAEREKGDGTAYDAPYSSLDTPPLSCAEVRDSAEWIAGPQPPLTPRDPFLSSGGSTQREQRLSSSVSEVDHEATTQPLLGVDAVPSTVSLSASTSPAPMEHVEKKGKEHSMKRPAAPSHTSPKTSQPSKSRLPVRGAKASASPKRKKKREDKRASNPAEQRPPTSLSEPPHSMHFSDLSLLRALNEDKGVGYEVRVHILVDDTITCATAPATALDEGQAAFLRDVVLQLGGSSTIGSEEDGEEGGEDHSNNSVEWKRHPHTRPSRAYRSIAVSHLVVSPVAVLTPAILRFKALGIAIVTPQWVLDAVALGAFPCVIPPLHAHPVYGDGLQEGGDQGREEELFLREDAWAGLVAPGNIVHLRGEAKEKVVMLGEGSGIANRHTDADAPRTAVKTNAHRPTAAFTASGNGTPRSSTLRQLQKEVVEEHVPVEAQARRPYYKPIFRDRMFYLYVPPIDLEQATQRGGVRSSGEAFGRRKEHEKVSYTPNGSGGETFGDVTSALEQVTALLRLLGGTVTRNLASTYLDVIIDLTGFYECAAEVGQQQQQQRQYDGWRPSVLDSSKGAVDAHGWHESLSCAYLDAVQRMSQLPDLNAEEPPIISHDAVTDTPTTALPPPIVGISWLLYVVLSRRWTGCGPFQIADHPLAAMVAALHPVQPPTKTPSDTTATVREAADVILYAKSMNSLRSERREQGRGMDVGGVSAGRDASWASGTSTDLSGPTPVHSSPSAPVRVLWPTEGVDVMAKTQKGPITACKEAAHQPSTQEIEAVLGDSGEAVHDVADTRAGTEPVFKVEEEAYDMDSFLGTIEYSDGA